MKLPKKITICEVGLRDGLQNESKILTVDEKVKIADLLVEAGFNVIEIGSFVHPKTVPQMASTDEVFKNINMNDKVEYRALVVNLKGVERAIECGCKKVKLNVSASKAHNIANINMTPEESVAKFKDCVDLATSNGIEVSGSISMPFGSPWEYKITADDVKNIVNAYVNLGIKEISLSDASGMAVPNQVYELCIDMKKTFPEVKWILHFHNTRGLGMANILAGMQAGITWFDSSFGGLGGCPFVPGAAGNVVTEDILHMCDEMGIKTGIDIDKSILIAKKMEVLLGRELYGYLLKAGKNSDLIKY
ncbi:hydroxymethylglutaryl-CoA lyase [Schnuerera sp. xch1]|uniref:hydroxymethylglutaryl-CoA lyase n=1 Tax=Schnuerera sp. xch1 TaxID=2874283 RepID=UPI001CBB9E5F|nr:hydroxymethylglutaryl-CoA lyase [Schnuerera sp. xch1]MBZ2174905.1 hydroxymethylglutaryl-CoA lyase [Schnuerera sp. xch1]